MMDQAFQHSPAFSDKERAGADRADVAIIGGGYSGASLAFLLSRARPELRIEILERQPCFDRKVGEATIELSALFMIRALGISTYLARNHLPKHGLRYWYQPADGSETPEPSEIGSGDCAHLPTYLLSRDELDEHILSMATDAGAELHRPARVRRVELGRFENYIEILSKEGSRILHTPWLIDASGRGTVLAKKFGWLERETPHRIGSMWARWRNTLDLDGLDQSAPAQTAPRTLAPRMLCTNHLAARDSWIWFIPLKNGEVSVGIVYHHDSHQLHQSTDRMSSYLDFIDNHPIAKRWCRDAELIEGDFNCLPLLPYRSHRYSGEGHALVGDAAGFIDPFYSPGLDHCSQTVMATSQLVERYFEEGDSPELATAIRHHDKVFTTSYQRLRDAVFVHKYRYMGEWDLFRAAYLLEVPGYFLALARPSWRNFEKRYAQPAFSGPLGYVLYRIGKFYNRRLARIADTRVRLGRAGRRNQSHRLSPVFDLGLPTIAYYLLQGAFYYLLAETRHLRDLLTQSVPAPPVENVRNYEPKQEESTVTTPTEFAKSTHTINTSGEL